MVSHVTFFLHHVTCPQVMVEVEEVEITGIIEIIMMTGKVNVI